jgi:hypothetical protein
MGVNVRLTEPDAIAHLPIRRLDGFGGFDELPDGGRCVGDLWF